MARLVTEDHEIDLYFYDLKSKETYYDTNWEELCYNTYNPEVYIFDKRAYPEPERPESYSQKCFKKFKERFIEATGLSKHEDIIAKLENFGLVRVYTATLNDFISAGLDREEIFRMYIIMKRNNYRLKHMTSIKNYIYPKKENYTAIIPQKEHSIFIGGPLGKYDCIPYRKKNVDSIIDYEKSFDERYKACDLETKLTKLPVVDKRFENFNIETSYKLHLMEFDDLKECIDSGDFRTIFKSRISMEECIDLMKVVRMYYKDCNWCQKTYDVFVKSVGKISINDAMFIADMTHFFMLKSFYELVALNRERVEVAIGKADTDKLIGILTLLGLFS